MCIPNSVTRFQNTLCLMQPQISWPLPALTKVVSSWLLSAVTQAKGSVLAAMFSGRWEQSLDHDADGRTFLDFDLYCVQEILSYLRRCNICSAVTTAIHQPEVEPRQQGEYLDVVKYLALKEFMGVAMSALIHFSASNSNMPSLSRRGTGNSCWRCNSNHNQWAYDS